MPRSWAMNPSTENTAKPAKILVALFKQHRAMQSLQQKKTWHDDPSLQNVKPQLIISMWVRPLTCSSCCCIGCSLQVRWVLPDTQRRRRTPESRHHATPAGGKILTFEFVYSYIWNLVVGITCATVLTAWWVMTLRVFCLCVHSGRRWICLHDYLSTGHCPDSIWLTLKTLQCCESHTLSWQCSKAIYRLQLELWWVWLGLGSLMKASVSRKLHISR